MKILIVFLLLFFSLLTLSQIYGISPKLQSESLNNKTLNYVNYIDEKNSTNFDLNLLKSENNVNLKKVYVSSNGTHLQIKFLFDNLLNELSKMVNNKTDNNFFINILIDSDDDVTTGFFGYDYRFLLYNNASNYKNNNSDSTINQQNNHFQNYSNMMDFLEGKELNDIMLRTLNSKNWIQNLDWVIKGYELLDYEFQPLFYYSKLDEKHLSVMPDGFKITLDLKPFGYPSNYGLFVDIGRKSEDYRLSYSYGKLHIPAPGLVIDDQTIDLNKGKNTAILKFNNTSVHNLMVNVKLLNKNISDSLSINFSQGNNFDFLSGQGIIPIEILLKQTSGEQNFIIPINISYSVMDEYDINHIFNNSLTNEHIYNKIAYLNLNLQKSNPFLKLDEIPAQYMAVFLGAIFSFFIPSITRIIQESRQKRHANIFLNSILKEVNSENIDIAINSVIKKLAIIKQEFIRGKISKDQYEILKEHIMDAIKDLISKKTNLGQNHKEKE